MVKIKYDKILDEERETDKLQELSNVYNETPTDNEIPQWNEANKRFELTSSPDFTTANIGTSTNYSQFETDGTLVFNGAATVWNDSMTPANTFRTGGTGLSLTQFIGNIWLLNFGVGDIFYVQVQMPHDMKLNTVIYPHLHLAVNSAIGATGYNVEVTTEHSWCNIDKVFPTPTVTSTGLVYSFQNAAQYKHGLMELTPLTPTASQGNISSFVLFKIERISSSVQPLNPAASLFILGLDIHYEIDTVGSRLPTVK